MIQPVQVGNNLHHWKGKIYINSKGVLNELISHKYNLTNILYHENQHRIDSDGKVDSFFEHAEVYLSQMGHSSFIQTTEEFKESIINGFCKRLLSHAVDLDNNNADTQIESAIINFNTLQVGYVCTYVVGAITKNNFIQIKDDSGVIISTVNYDSNILSYED